MLMILPSSSARTGNNSFTSSIGARTFVFITFSKSAASKFETGAGVPPIAALLTKISIFFASKPFNVP